MKWLRWGENGGEGKGCALPSGGVAGRYFPVALFVLTLTALLLRSYAATDNFWLDEIFTYYLAMNQVHAAGDLFTGIKVEHQFLVTLGIHLMGDQLNWVWYRIPSVIAGAGTIVLMAAAGYRRMGAPALIFTLAVAAVSYPLVVYSSEARGYAPAAFFSLLMFIFLDRYWRRRNQAWLAGYWSASVIAVLYHPSAVCVSVSLGLWSVAREWRSGAVPMRVVRELAVCHAVPLSFMVWLYLAVMRPWGTVGGDILPLARVIGDTLAVALGFPMRPEFRWGALLLGGACITAGPMVVAGLVRSDRWVFYLSVLLLAPALLLGVGGRPYVYVRYFVVLFPFFFLMLGEALDAVAARWRETRAAVIGLFVLVLVGNVLATADFLRVGRGGYRDAVAYMAAATPRPEIRVGSDHDFRNGFPLIFYGRYLPKDRNLVYFGSDAWPPEGPDWLLIHNTCSEEFVPRPAVTARGGTYRLEKSYPVLGLSGVGWHLYRNPSRF